MPLLDTLRPFHSRLLQSDDGHKEVPDLVQCDAILMIVLDYIDLFLEVKNEHDRLLREILRSDPLNFTCR